jgi:pimeloyl-ACP methyl ester carboxylesterase
MTVSQVQIPVGVEVFDALVAGPDEGELVILLHGFPQTSAAWRSQLETLAGAGYRVVAPDQRGYSPGARPDAVERYRVQHLVADVLAMAYEVGGHRFHLVGHDWGAAVAWQVAGRHAQRLRTLTAVSVPHPAALSAAMADERSDQRQRSAYMEMLRSEGAAEKLLADDAALLREFYSSGGMAPDEAAPYLEVLRDPAALDAALNWYRAADRTLFEGFGPVTTPTLYVWSTEDTALGRDAAEATAGHVEGPYRFEVLEGVDHWIPEHAPAELDRLLLDHLANGESAAGG